MRQKDQGIEMAFLAPIPSHPIPSQLLTADFNFVDPEFQ